MERQKYDERVSALLDLIVSEWGPRPPIREIKREAAVLVAERSRVGPRRGRAPSGRTPTR